MTKARRIWLIGALIFLAMLIVGSFVDFSLSTSVYRADSILGILLASVGEWPAYAGLAFLAGGALAWMQSRKPQGLRLILLAGLSACAFVLGIYFQGKAFCDENAWGRLAPSLDKSLWRIAVGLVMVAPWALPGYRLLKKNGKETSVHLLVSLMLMIAAGCVACLVLKSFMHRPRFRFIVDVNGGEGFVNWWRRFDGYKALLSDTVTSDCFKSFPSFHTGGAAVLMLLGSYLPYFKPEWRGREGLFALIGLIFALLVAASRVAVGAHFLSDVAFGGLLMTVMGFVMDFVLRRNTPELFRRADR